MGGLFLEKKIECPLSHSTRKSHAYLRLAVVNLVVVVVLFGRFFVLVDSFLVHKICNTLFIDQNI